MGARGKPQKLRMTGLSDARLPSLERVERRRLQLWALAAFVIVGAALAALLGSAELDNERFWWANRWSLQLSLLAISMGFVLYAIEKELSLRRLTRQLIDERTLSAALTTRINELTALMEAGQAVNSVLDLDDVLQIILRGAIDLLGGVEGSVMMLQEDGMLEAVCTYGNVHAQGRKVAVGDGIAGRVAQTRQPLLISGVAGEGELPGREQRATQVESAMCVPLQNRDELLGVINCNAPKGEAFSDYDLRAFTLFAEHAAIAVANARLYEVQRRHVEELLELDEMKNEFISSVSHDLRTPLTSIVGSASVAMRKDLGEAARAELLASIRRQADRLGAMVQQLLEAAALRKEAVAPAAEPVDLSERARALVADQTTDGTGIEVLGPRRALVACRQADLDRILANLLENARKHGEPPIIVRITLDGSEVRCSVSDGGRGIPAELRERVFERFFRADRSRSMAGLGLGLSIVRGLVEAHGGRTWVDGAQQGRTAVCFALPVFATVDGSAAEELDPALSHTGRNANGS